MNKKTKIVATVVAACMVVCIAGAIALLKSKPNSSANENGTSAINSTAVSEQNQGTNEDGAPNSSSNGTPFEQHGKLQIENGKVVDKNGDVFLLKGVSSHGINWDVGYPFVNKDSMQTLRDEWGVNCFRVAMYTDDYNGYCVTDSASQQQLLNIIDTAVNAANELGIYVIIDWHILNDGNPNIHREEAKSFFADISNKYKDYGNVLYEICNEPNGVSWDDVKSYAEYIIPTIRENADNIIIVGTPTWSQDVDVASNSQIEGYENIAYTLHFYAATHKEQIQQKVETAVANGLPIIVTEFSACAADGNGSLDFASVNSWMQLLEDNDIGCVCWSLSNKDEAASLLTPSCQSTSNYTSGDLSAMGQWLVDEYTK